MPSIFHLDTGHCLDAGLLWPDKQHGGLPMRKEGILRLNWGPKRQNSQRTAEKLPQALAPSGGLKAQSGSSRGQRGHPHPDSQQPLPRVRARLGQEPQTDPTAQADTRQHHLWSHAPWLAPAAGSSPLGEFRDWGLHTLFPTCPQLPLPDFLGVRGNLNHLFGPEPPSPTKVQRLNTPSRAVGPRVSWPCWAWCSVMKEA